MMFLDTHVLIWLYLGEVELFPAAAQSRLESEELVFSPMALLELQYLHELKRISDPPSIVLRELSNLLGVTPQPDDFEGVMLHAIGESWTRDPFDRLIVGHARMHSALLLSKDRAIRRNYSHALWD